MLMMMVVRLMVIVMPHVVQSITEVFIVKVREIQYIKRVVEVEIRAIVRGCHARPHGLHGDDAA